MLSSNEDRVLTCKDCGAQFVFTAGEQEFYASRGLMHAPGRCQNCRATRKARGGSDSQGMGSDGGFRRERTQREMHPAVCSQCGKDTLVPFLPRGDKPVYCSSCFEQVRSYR
ncbi:MAG TPA: zinc-ribbon domain containing protein [Chloroflexota bacterium]|nr:zinc-ribbon domain containing protein [Chloroflexota bacterium]